MKKFILPIIGVIALTAFFSIFIVIAFFFSALTISEIFEDYIHNEKIKSVANKLLYFFAIIFPLITITILLKIGL